MSNYIIVIVILEVFESVGVMEFYVNFGSDYLVFIEVMMKRQVEGKLKDGL